MASVSDKNYRTSQIDGAGLDPASLEAIRNMMSDEPGLSQGPAGKPSRRVAAEMAAPMDTAARRSAKAAALPPLEAPSFDPAAEIDHTGAAAPARARFRLPKLPSLRRRAAPAPAPAAQVETGGRGLSFRPSKRHFVLLAALALLYFHPWLVLGLTFLWLFVIVGLFLMLGFDGFWQGVTKCVKWYGRRRPKRAALLHRRLDSLAMKWDAVLDRFPEGMVDGLYLPDMGELDLQQKRHDEVLTRRMNAMRTAEARSA